MERESEMIPFFCFMETKITLKKINIEETGCHLLLNAVLNGSIVRLVLDTGASRTVIDSNFYLENNPNELLKEEEEKSIGVGSSQLDSYLTKVPLFEIGELSLKNLEIALMDLSNVSLTYHNLGIGEVHGVLGGDILADNYAQIDYKKLTLCLRSYD